MIVAPQPREVRQIVVRTFQELGCELRQPAELSEMLLLDGGHYVARSYRAEGLLAMWLVEAGILQFYDADGNMLRTVNLFELANPLKAAA